MRNHIVYLSFFLAPFIAFSQDKWEAGLQLGYTNYLGDMVEPSFTFDQSSFAGGVYLRHHVSPRFGLRSNLVLGKVKGADANYEKLAERGASFESELIELSLMGEYEFFGNRRWDEKGNFRKIISPYVFTGVGMAFTSSTIDLDAAQRPSAQKSDDLSADFNENIQFALPVGMGIKFDLSRKVNLGLDWGWRLTFSDYLDGLSLAGDPDHNDIYVFGGITAGVLIGEVDDDEDGISNKEDKCPNVPGLVQFDGCPDVDGDGIVDAEDECPNYPGSLRLKGCPDRDNDGIADNVDDCPDAPGIQRFSGCPDTDFDGIVDQEDNCPEVAGIVSMNGCPDADRDGIADYEDNCPTEPGLPAYDGCPDSDGDGVYDNIDECARTPGLASLNGCPDTDSDGVADNKDKCPEVRGTPENSGCPDIKPEEKEILDFAMKNVRFETSSADLLSGSYPILDKIVDIMNRNPSYQLRISGHTDNMGNPIFNQQLSERRARACQNYLSAKGISATRMKSTGFGAKKPKGDNATEEGRRLNRRVEFELNQ